MRIIREKSVEEWKLIYSFSSYGVVLITLGWRAVLGAEERANISSVWLFPLPFKCKMIQFKNLDALCIGTYNLRTYNVT